MIAHSMLFWMCWHFEAALLVSLDWLWEEAQGPLQLEFSLPALLVELACPCFLTRAFP